MEPATSGEDAVGHGSATAPDDEMWGVLLSKGVDAFVDSYVDSQIPPCAADVADSLSTKELEASLRSLHSKVSAELEVGLCVIALALFPSL